MFYVDLIACGVEKFTWIEEETYGYIDTEFRDDTQTSKETVNRYSMRGDMFAMEALKRWEL